MNASELGHARTDLMQALRASVSAVPPAQLHVKGVVHADSCCPWAAFEGSGVCRQLLAVCCI